MLKFFRDRRIKKYVQEVLDYINISYVPYFYNPNIKYSLNEFDDFEDSYDADEVSSFLDDYINSNDDLAAKNILEKNINHTFVDLLLFYIKKRDVRDSVIYKTAQIDRRLFSKIVSNREYKPSKDTAIAFAFALNLTLEETNDILSRAGYTLSHSNKRDIIIEYFFRKRIYSLADVNEVLYRFEEKIIGRF